MTWQGVTVHRRYGLSHRLDTTIEQDGRIVRTYRDLKAFGLDRASSLYFTIEDVGNGAEELRLTVYNLKHKTPLWHCDDVGVDAGFVGDRCVFTLVENHGRAYCVATVNKYKGTSPRSVYEEPDKRFHVELVIQPGHVFVKLSNALSQRIGFIQDDAVRWMTPAISAGARGRGHTLVPVTDRVYLTNTALKVIGSGYHPLPDGFIVDAMPIHEAILLSTIQDGCESLYVFHLKSERFDCLYKSSSPCELHLQQWTTDPTVRISTPNKPTVVFEVVGLKAPTLKRQGSLPESVSLPYYHHGFATSKDGTRVPYTVVSHVKKPRHLIVEAYGAYGSSSRRTYPIPWLLWLANGYALAVAMPRGGRDNGDAWYDGGRTPAQKRHTFEDTAAVVETVQKRFRIPPDQTAFYGRSAGGWTAAAMAQVYPHLFRVVYTEVPYVDVIRTASNPMLPLTQLEYDEFGNPRVYAEFEQLKTLSPMETIPPAPAGSPTIIVKTGLNDVQVLPYETLKWAHRLRAKGWTVFAGIDGAGGHFAEETDFYRQKAEDFVLMDSLFEGPKGRTCVFCKTRRRR
jgi:protease II